MSAELVQAHDYAQQEAASATQSATNLAALDPPPIEGGEQFKQQVVDAYTAAAQTWDQIATSIAAIEPTDPDVLAELTAALAQMHRAGLELSIDSGNPEQALGKPMQDAMLTAPACAETG